MGKRKKSKSRRSRGGLGKGIRALFSWITFLIVKTFPVVFCVGIVLGIGFGVKEVLCADSQLQIKNIMVHPPLALSPEQRKSIETRYIGKNLLLVDLDRIAKELESDPEIKQAKVVRKFPSLLNISVEKRESFAYVRFEDKSGKIGVVSEDGMILDVVKETLPTVLMVEFFSLDQKNLRVGYRISHTGFARAVSFAKKYWSHPLSDVHPLTRLSLDHIGNTAAEFSGPPPVRLGRFPDERFDVLEKALHILEGGERKKIDYIDLQYDNVIVKNKR